MDKRNHLFGECGRRDFVKAGIAAGLGMVLAGDAAGAEETLARDIGPAPEQPFAAAPMKRVRVGFVGVGKMGGNHVRNLLRLDGVELKAVCDIRPEAAERAQGWAVEAGQRKPKAYTAGPEDFRRMCEKEELDLVYTATPWEWHVPVCVAAMQNGNHAATEVPAAVTLEECWQLVEAAEKHQKHCVMMENCCYNRTELAVLNMVRRGVLGELLHGEGAYIHDLRGEKLGDVGEGLWRRAHSIKRNGNLYPTHGLGPIAQCMNINRGDRFDYLVSMSSNSRCLSLYAAEHLPADDPKRKETYLCGDVNTSLIRTVNGLTIALVHDCSTPRPYSRVNLVQGTKGGVIGYPDRVYIEGRSKFDEWEPMEKYFDEFEHPLWKKLNPQAQGSLHGGMDFIEDYRLIQCLREGKPTDMNVYDAASWSAVSELSERSTANRSQSVEFPDFTRGRWKTNPPLGIVEA